MGPEDLVLYNNVALTDTADNGATSSVGEPTVANNGRQIYMTGNWYASKSLDNGASWQYVNPFSTLPSTAGGFCCDQVTLYDKSRDLFIWLLQYIRDSDGTNVLRLAIKQGPNLQTNSGWYWWDFAPGGVRDAWSDDWFDYPDLSLSNNHLWLSSNVFNSSSRWQGAAVLKLPLDGLATPAAFGYSFWSTTSNGSLRFTQGAGDEMYWASHNSGSQVRLFRWPDDSNTISQWDRNVNSWAGGNYSAPGPDGRNWLGRTDGRITGAWIGDGVIGLMWTSNSHGNRPFPYVRVVRLDAQTKAVINQPDIWSSAGAWAYPAAAANCRGHAGASLFFGGGDWGPPAHLVGVWDDYKDGFDFRVVRYSTNGPDGGRWGDYLSVRPHSPDDLTWIASGYTLRGGTARTNVVPGYVHFGRRRDERTAARWANA